jgi:hypothetical protein
VSADALPREGVPKGELRGPFVLPNSQAYPGTQHTYWVHVPAQYDPAVPASLMIFQDGQAFIDMNGNVRAPNVLDNLIYRRELPLMITVFINPGRTPEQPEPTPSEWGDRTTNRPTEYNSLDDRYARVIRARSFDTGVTACGARWPSLTTAPRRAQDHVRKAIMALPTASTQRRGSPGRLAQRREPM